MKNQFQVKNVKDSDPSLREALGISRERSEKLFDAVITQMNDKVNNDNVLQAVVKATEMCENANEVFLAGIMTQDLMSQLDRKKKDVEGLLKVLTDITDVLESKAGTDSKTDIDHDKK